MTDMEQPLVNPEDRKQFRGKKGGVPHHLRPTEEELNNVENRTNFIKKVYGILFSQMLMTCVVSSAMMFCEPIRVFCMAHMMSQAFRIMLLIPTLCSLCCLMAKKNDFPTNFYILYFFTFCMSLSVGGICAAYYQAGMGILIAEAFAITAVLFISLSAYTILSGKNFSWMGGFLFAALVTLCGVGFLAIFIPGLRQNIIFPIFGALIFCAYIVYDTWRLTSHYGYDDYMMAAIELYLDIINLFLYILEILSKKK